MIDTLPISVVSRLIEESFDAVLVIDEHGTVRYMNGAMQALSGYAPAEALGQPLFGLLPESSGDQYYADVSHFLANTTEPGVLGTVREFAIRHRTGDTIPIEMKALDLGVVEGLHYYGAFMTDLRPRREIEARNAALLTQLERQAMSDALTELPNRRAFEAEAMRIAARAKRNNTPVTVGLADIDHFKRVNDQYGHPVGDEVLRAVSAVLVQAARSADYVARIGGEEFGLLFPDATLDSARSVAERMRQAVESCRIMTAQGQELRATISIGLASYGSSLSEGLSRADTALYEAKNDGRNRVKATVNPS